MDYKLLSGLVQDIWDKFQEPRFTTLNRHKNEAETLWVMQKHYWVEKLREMGMLYTYDDNVQHPTKFTLLH